MRIHRSLSEPLRIDPSWEERWERADQGLINCWECGREWVLSHPEQAKLANGGELLVLPWKGGVNKNAKKVPAKKTGSLYYVAMWQGLRSEDLDIDIELGAVLQCAATGTIVTYQFDMTSVEEEEEEEQQDAEAQE